LIDLIENLLHKSSLLSPCFGHEQAIATATAATSATAGRAKRELERSSHQLTDIEMECKSFKNAAVHDSLCAGFR